MLRLCLIRSTVTSPQSTRIHSALYSSDIASHPVRLTSSKQHYDSSLLDVLQQQLGRPQRDSPCQLDQRSDADQNARQQDGQAVESRQRQQQVSDEQLAARLSATEAPSFRELPSASRESIEEPKSPSAEYRSKTTAFETTSLHWMDRRMPGARQWLELKNRHWWLRGVKARCRQHPMLQGREDMVTQLVDEKYDALLLKHAALAIDGRAETHLRVAALLLATYRTLSPWLKDDKEIVELLKEHVAGQSSAIVRMLLRGTLMLSRDPYKWQAFRLKALQLDQGAAFQSHLESTKREASLRIRRCFYADFFKEEGAPSLTRATCCSADLIWFEGLEKYGVGFERPQCLAAGQACCELRVRNMQKQA